MPEPKTTDFPPQAALDWFKAKGIQPGFDYRDVWLEEQANAFTVAKMLNADLLVEVHEGMRPGTLALLTQRFAASHHIQRLDRKLDDSALTGWMDRLSDLDRLLLLWEWRASPTPWLWMTRRNAPFPHTPVVTSESPVP